jgi:NADH:ubiquinone oxidoreductase subunit F (NADH-binding)
MTSPAIPARHAATTQPQSTSHNLPRLLPPDRNAPEHLRTHLTRHGPVPYRGASKTLIRDIEASGLTGRGGGAFPVARKLTAVEAARGRPVVVANGAETEPASQKDVTLLWLAPHLVLDGLQLAAEAVGATSAYLYLHPGTTDTLGAALTHALAQREEAGQDRLPVYLTEAPPRFIAGQESAAVSRINGGPALPTYTPPLVSQRGVDGAPTLVQNVETLAHLALIARYGPQWFRSAGTRDEPGTMLCTIYPADGEIRIAEAALGTPLTDLLPDPEQKAQAILIGGYHGTWLPAAQAARLTLDNGVLRQFGAAVGAGILSMLPADRCGLAETARVARYLALESAGQCGPCLNGLPRIAAALADLAGPRPQQRTLADIERWAGLVTGRGACRHPDGTARFVISALAAFREEIGRHTNGRCSARTRDPFLPIPAAAPVTDDDWR